MLSNGKLCVMGLLFEIKELTKELKASADRISELEFCVRERITENVLRGKHFPFAANFPKLYF